MKFAESGRAYLVREGVCPSEVGPRKGASILTRGVNSTDGV